MADKYQVRELNICTFSFTDKGIIPDLNKYPKRRLCVIDLERKRAVDVNQELEYDYIETVSQLYFMSESIEKIEEDKRVAVFPVINLDIDTEKKEKISKIIRKLNNKEKFLDGNKVLSNEEYLELLQEGEPSKSKGIFGIKRLIKRKK